MSDSEAWELHDLRVEVVAGAVCEPERDRAGPHGRIMRRDLSREGGDTRA